MSWEFSFEVPGAPPSTNNAYKIVIIRRPLPIRTLAKTQAAIDYQELTRLLAIDAMNRAAGSFDVPRGEYIRVEFQFFLKRHQDTDNAKKFLNDGLKAALKVDDRWFLGTDVSKTVNSKSDPRTILTVRYPA